MNAVKLNIEEKNDQIEIFLIEEDFRG